MRSRFNIFIPLLVLFTILALFFSRNKILKKVDELKLKSCHAATNQQSRSNCYRSIIKSATKRGDLDLAVNVYNKAIRDDMDPDGCHLAGHEIGRDIYESLTKSKVLKIADSMDECGYGFWHGFLSGLAPNIANQSIQKSDVFRICQDLLGDNLGLDICYHGIGLGFVGDPPDLRLWGNYSDIVSDSMDKCRVITRDPILSDACNEGVFHQLFTYMKDGLYGLSLPNDEELFYFCSEFDGQYQKSCLNMISPYFYNIGEELSFVYETAKTKFNWVDKNTQLDIFANMTMVLVENTPDLALASNLEYCFTLPDDYRNACMGGFFWEGVNRETAVVSNDDHPMAKICNQANIEAVEKSFCLDFVRKGGK